MTVEDDTALTATATAVSGGDGDSAIGAIGGQAEALPGVDVGLDKM